MSADEKKWEQLTLDEKLTELGFVKGFKYEPLPNLPDQEARLHGALDQLLDAGEMLVEIEAMCMPAGTGNPSGDELNVCTDIYSMLNETDADEAHTDN